GKSTLLHVLGGLDAFEAGHVHIGDARIEAMSDDERVEFRNHSVGFVFQFHHLLPEFSAIENVEMPLFLAGVAAGERRDRARRLLDRVGLSARIEHRPGALSGGEQQRVAVARALVGRPDLLLADEPTGNLDEVTAETVFGELVAMVRNFGIGALIATHNIDMAKRMDRIVALHEGRLYTAASTE